jgi:hypothetical protein
MHTERSVLVETGIRKLRMSFIYDGLCQELLGDDAQEVASMVIVPQLRKTEQAEIGTKTDSIPNAQPLTIAYHHVRT